MDNVGDAKQQFKIFFPFPGITDEASPIRLHALFSANVETKTSDNQGLFILLYCCNRLVCDSVSPCLAMLNFTS